MEYKKTPTLFVLQCGKKRDFDNPLKYYKIESSPLLNTHSLGFQNPLLPDPS